MTTTTNRTISLGIPANESLEDAHKDMDQFANFLYCEEAFQKSKKRIDDIKNKKIRLVGLLLSCSDKKHKKCQHNMDTVLNHKNIDILCNIKQIKNNTTWCMEGTGWVKSGGVEQLKKEILNMKEISNIELDFNLNV